jgi:Mor family transcriptional regulator
MADLKLTVDYSELMGAVKSANQTKQAIRLLGQQFSRTGDQSAYMRAVNQIVASQKNLAVNARMSRGEIMKLANQYKQTTAFTDQLARAQMQLNAATQMSTKGLARSGVVMQQTGYQVGDFLVQVQSGTNMFVAFGQQATQLAGLLTMSVNPKLIALGAALSIIIPLTTAVAAAFMRTRGATEEAKDSYEGLGESLSKLEGIRLNTIGESLASGAKQAVEQWQNVLNILERVEIRNLQGVLQQQFDTIVAQLQSFEVRIQTAARLRTEEPTFDLFGLSNMEQGIRFAQILRSVQGDSREELQEQLRLAEERLRSEGLLTTETETILANLANQLGIVDTITAQVKQEQGVQQKINDILAERVESYTETQQTVNDTIDGLNRQIAAQERIIRFGKDSELVAKRTTEAILEEEAARLRAAGATEEEIDRVIELKKELIEVTEEAESLESAISNINKVSMGSVIAQVANLASVLNITTEAAMALAGVLPAALTRERAIAQAGTSGGRGSAGMPIPGQFGLQSTAYPNAGQIAQDLLDKEAGKDKGPDAIERLQQEIAFRQRILNLSQEERDLQTEIFRITNALGKDRNKYSSDFIANLAQQNLAIQEQERVIEDARKQQEQLADSIANSFGDAFMSMVDGTKSAKDAFRSMAADIIRELYRVLVVQRMVNSISGALGPGGSSGGFLSSLFGGRESGGSMMAGRPYIVGERGPELVIPGRSSTVTNADLTRKSMGGSDAVNVVNNINVTGGTDPAAIRQEVAKLMPQITNATKSAVIDARRRGGQMKAAFG